MPGKLQVLFLFIVLLSFSGKGQELFFTNLNSNVLLPSQECYKVLQDNEGYIWFSTDKGLCRYSSGKLQVFDKKNGLPEESVYEIEKDKTGKMWFATSMNRILYYDKDRLTEPKLSHKYQKSDFDAAKVFPLILFFNVGDPEWIYVSNAMNSYKISKSTGKIIRFQKYGGISFVLRKSDANDTYTASSFTLNESVYPTVRIKSGSKTKDVLLKESPMKTIAHRSVFTGHPYGCDVVGISREVFVFNKDLGYNCLRMPDDVLNITVDDNNGVWIAVRNKGVYYYKDIRTGKYDHHSLRNYSVTDICLDNENGVWCSTLEHGIFYCANRSLYSYVSEGYDKQLIRIRNTGGKLFLVKGDNITYYYKGKFSEFRKGYSFPYINDIHHFRNSWYVCGKVHVSKTDEAMKARKQILYQPQGNLVALATGNSFAEYDNELYIGMHSGLTRVKSNNFLEVLNQEFLRIALYILDDGQGNILMGGSNGLFGYNIATKKVFPVSEAPKNINGFSKDSSGTIWIITKNDGVFTFRNGKVTKLRLRELEDVRFFDISAADNGVVWMASNRGIYAIERKGTELSVRNYGIPSGIPSSEVYKLACYEGQIWFSTFEGLFCITDPGQMNLAITPRIRIRSADIGRKVQESAHSFFVSDHNQLVSFSFDFLSYKNPDANKLHYQLINSSGDTLSATVPGDQVSFNGLDPGSYKLIVRGVCFDGTESNIPEVITIYVATPFYLTWWFITLCFILLIFLFVVFLRYFTGRIRKREKAETQINKRLAEFQMTALQAQMNPHFIFNAINTIQGYILQRNEEEAYKYLAKFSKLIRIVLHHSREKELLLSDEIEMLNLYIELEQLRFDRSFDLEMIIADDVDPENTYLPGMLLQPYIENAIWHGLVNLQGVRRGKLTISFGREENYLTVKIEDNGIGRVKAKDYRKNTSHKSVSMDLTSERIQLMKAIYDFDHKSIEIVDKSDKNNVPTGTIVVLHIPFI